MMQISRKIQVYHGNQWFQFEDDVEREKSKSFGEAKHVTAEDGKEKAKAPNRL